MHNLWRKYNITVVKCKMLTALFNISGKIYCNNLHIIFDTVLFDLKMNKMLGELYYVLHRSY